MSKGPGSYSADDDAVADCTYNIEMCARRLFVEAFIIHGFLNSNCV
jgi:hypothetical protein